MIIDSNCPTCQTGQHPKGICPNVDNIPFCMSEVEILSPRSRPLHYGNIVWSWCSYCMDRTDHIYKPTLMDFHFSYLICLACHPELKEEVNQ